MSRHLNFQDWLIQEADMPPMGAQPDMGAGGPPMSQPGSPGDPMGQNPPANQMTGDPSTDPMGGPDVANDPPFPEMPEEKSEDDFEVWKIKYAKESIKGDPNDLINMLLKIRDNELEDNNRRFVEENFQVNILRRNPAVFEASQEIRKLIKTDFDQTHPGVSVMNHIVEVLSKHPMLNEVYLKAANTFGKGQIHRGFVCALLGAMQVGSGYDEPDLIFEETDYSIHISTRMNARWGNVFLGQWSLSEDDPERYLKEPEITRLEGGSPEERDVLRRRVVIESIAERFRERAFIINTVGTDGTVQHLGWDLGNSLKAAYLDGKLVVRTQNSDRRDAFVDESGSIVSIPNLNIYYVKESPTFDDNMKAGIEEIEFMRCDHNELILSAPLDLLKEASISLQGMVFKETPWQGNPTDLLRVTRCSPTLPEIIMKDCM